MSLKVGKQLKSLETVLLLGFFIITGALSVLSAQGRTRRYVWKVEKRYKSVDCFKKLVITINGSAPGPTIYAREGDTVIVEVINGLITENTAIHWHGIRQIGTPWSDGAEAVTQCPILPGEHFFYNFVVDRAGTFMYHAHYGMQSSDGLVGMIIVSVKPGFVEPFKYDHDRNILLTDWWHKSKSEQTTGLLSKPFTWVGEPQSLLIQGRGRYNCSLINDDTLCRNNNTDCSPYVLKVDPGKTYRLRVGSLTSLSALNFEIEGHNMTVVEADGHYVAPFLVSNLYIYSGETYSVLITANQDPSNKYWIATNVVSRPPNTDTGLAILNYRQQSSGSSPSTNPPIGPLWNDTAPRIRQSLKIKAHRDHIISPPKTSDQTIILLNTQNKIDGYIKWSINNVSYTLPQIPYLISLKKNVTDAFDQSPAPVSYDYQSYDIYSVQTNPNATSSSSIYRLEFNSTVDIILQNGNTLNPNNSETHPWHFHGHDFWVLGYGTGKYDPKTDLEKNSNLVDPIMKNTVPLHPYGWTAIRFIADNPGAWFFHCHIDPHLLMGMSVVFEQGIHRVGKLPSSIMSCVPRSD
ncbi:L-ascorbate oxidase [Zostera marina]|uniref:L-ascorbate oxidase n=1 Tax=Zostera marina TaxID=29655 RepID=A0A0K9NMH1_ZOSMR|nr:L-ascorbate oxidase [Zostera marina]